MLCKYLSKVKSHISTIYIDFKKKGGGKGRRGGGKREEKRRKEKQVRIEKRKKK